MKKLKRFRGNMVFITDFSIPLYEDHFIIRTVYAKVSGKRIYARAYCSPGENKYAFLYAADFHCRAEIVRGNAIIVHDYSWWDRLERVAVLIPHSNELNVVKLYKAREYEEIETITYVFQNSDYFYGFDLEEEEIDKMDIETIKKLFKLQREWDEMVRNS